jgi:hypothetical protein
MAEPKNWEVEHQHGDGEERTGLMSDQELNRAERASGDHVEERPAAYEEKERVQEAEQERDLAEREQRDRQQEQERRKQQERERQELIAELHQMREHEAQQQREQAAEQARQRQESGQERTYRDQEPGGGRMESDEEAIQRITAEEERTARETKDRRAQEKADLLKDMREGKEHYYGNEWGSSSEEHTRYNPDLQQEAATRQYEDAVRQAGVGQAGGQNDSPEQSRGQSVPEQTQAPEMEMER